MLTLDLLQGRCWSLVNTRLCKMEEESIGHILLYHDKSGIFWQLLFSLFDVFRLFLFRSWRLFYSGMAVCGEKVKVYIDSHSCIY